MTDQLIGPGPRCWTCFEDYGQHTPECSVGIQLAADRAKEERIAVVRDCDHDWKPSGMFLMKMADTYRYGDGCVSGQQVVGGLSGYGLHQTPEVEICSRCGLLRIPIPK